MPIASSPPDAGATWASRASAWLAVLALLAIGALMLWTRQQALQHDYHQTDENIATAVTARVLDEGTLDTNWARTGVIAEFRYDQYNFSAYHLAAAAWLAIGGATTSGDTLPALRWMNVLLFALVMALTAWLAWRYAGATAAIVATALTAVAPSLFQDSIYARPEVFCTLLVLLLLLLMGGRASASVARLAAAGALIGVLVATKITFVVLAPLTLLALLAGRDAPRLGAPAFFGFCLALAAGFAFGAPWAVMRPWEYLDGVSHLLQQYGSGHLPHGVPQDPAPVRLLFGLDYLRHTVGPVALALAVPGAWRLWRTRRIGELLMLAGCLATMLYFLQTRAFFERNLSHALPLLFVLAGAGVSACVSWPRHRRLARGVFAAGLGAAALAVPVSVSYILLREALPGGLAQQQREAESNIAESGHVLADFVAVTGRVDTMPDWCGMVALRVRDYGHPYLRAAVERQMAAWGYDLRHHLIGPFAHLPTSTLHTYHGSDLRYFVPRQPWSERCAVGVSSLRALAGRGRAIEGVEVQLQGSAARDAQEPGASLPDWPWALYGTHAGSDAHLGAVGFATIRACGDFAVPAISGPNREGSLFRVARVDDGGEQVLFEGPLPALAVGWTGLQVRHRDPGCAEYRLLASDNASSWGGWIGLGHPVALDSTTPSLFDLPADDPR